MVNEPNSLWAHTANTTKKRRPLESNLQVDAVIIGAGFTGLLTGYHLQSMGVNTVIIEKECMASGASGTNGGMLIPSFREGLHGISKRFGLEAAKNMHQFQQDAVTLMKQIIRQHQIDCSLTTGGYLKAAHEQKFVSLLKQNQQFLFDHFGYETMLVEGEDTKAHINSDSYCGGLIDPNGMSFHPLNYALGIADVFEQLGGVIYEQTEVTKLQKEMGGFLVTAKGGDIKAEHVVVATNGYTTEITPKLRRSIIPKKSYVIATEPLDEVLCKQLLGTNKSVSDTKESLYYFRLTPDNRMLFGGSVDINNTGSETIYQEIHQNMLSVFPELKNYHIDFKWGGVIAKTADEFPHIGKTEEGFHYALGYNGRGALVTTLMGRLLALNIIGKERNVYSIEQMALPEISLHA